MEPNKLSNINSIRPKAMRFECFRQPTMQWYKCQLHHVTEQFVILLLYLQQVVPFFLNLVRIHFGNLLSPGQARRFVSLLEHQYVLIVACFQQCCRKCLSPKWISHHQHTRVTTPLVKFFLCQNCLRCAELGSQRCFHCSHLRMREHNSVEDWRTLLQYPCTFHAFRLLHNCRNAPEILSIIVSPCMRA